MVPDEEPSYGSPLETRLHERPFHMVVVTAVVSLVCATVQILYPHSAPTYILSSVVGASAPPVAVGLLARIIGQDPLTKLKSLAPFWADGRALFRRRSKREPALLLIDANGLKAINDKYGHAAGNEVIQKMASVCRKYDLSYRLHGDENAILLRSGGRSAAELVKARIKKAIQEMPSEYGPLSCGVGIAVLSPSVRTFQELYRAADADLYRDKRASK